MTFLKTPASLFATPLLMAAALASGAGHAAGPKNGLVAHYCFNKTVSGDCSGGGNHGTPSGSVQLVPGVLGTAAKFGGYQNIGSIEVPSSPSLSFGNIFTISYWVRVDDPAGENAFGQFVPYATQIAVAKSHDAQGLFSYVAPAPGTGAVGFIDYGAGALLGAPTPVEIGKWLHVTVTHRSNPNCLRLYVNGRLARTIENAGYSFDVANTLPLFLGAQAPLFGNNLFRYPLNGALDEVRIYNRELSAVEIFLIVLSDRYGIAG
jgi:hypothetical protein